MATRKRFTALCVWSCLSLAGWGWGCAVDGQFDGDGNGDGGGAQDGCPLEAPAGQFAIVCISPADQQTRVPPGAPVEITFNRSVNTGTLQGDLDVRGTSQDFELVWSDNDRVLSIEWTEGRMLDDTSYFIQIFGGQDTAGNELSNPTSSCFSTGATLDCPQTLECLPLDATDGVVGPYAEFDYQRPFADDSPFNTLIGPQPAVDPDSEVMIARFAQTAADVGGIWLGAISSSVPVYVTDADTPRYDVTLTDPFAPSSTLQGVPIPDGALQDCGPDRFFVLYDSVDDTYYELWRSERSPEGSWTAITGNTISGQSSGIYPGDGNRSSEGIRASGFSLAAGIIWPHELQAQRIDHALEFTYVLTRTGPAVPPATSNDGQNDDPAAMPMGTHLQLDPELDLGNLGLEPWEWTIATALQEFGMYLGDTGGGISISLLHGHSFAGNPYAGLLPDIVAVDGGLFMNKIPFERFRVLLPPD